MHASVSPHLTSNLTSYLFAITLGYQTKTPLNTTVCTVLRFAQHD